MRYILKHYQKFLLTEEELAKFKQVLWNNSIRDFLPRTEELKNFIDPNVNYWLDIDLIEDLKYLHINIMDPHKKVLLSIKEEDVLDFIDLLYKDFYQVQIEIEQEKSLKKLAVLELEKNGITPTLH